MTVAVFSYAGWAARYPELEPTVTEPLALELFEEAGLYLDNTDGSIVPADDVTYQPRLLLLGMLVAHLAALRSPDRAGMVGRIASAGQGSVNVSTVMDGQAPGGAWYLQTQYGASYWAATARYRTARFVQPAASATVPPWLR
ncbi:MAG: DUF4054 domain-containing protein [Caulobacteraceae bacterium]|nr:DUF4054 domain-containing protein [Caulobacteraceae bacterium]